MNSIDKEIFVSAAALGTQAGYQTVYEWLTNYLLMIERHRHTLSQPDAFMGQVVRAFAAFEAKSLQSSQTVEQFVEKYVTWYNLEGKKMFSDQAPGPSSGSFDILKLN